MKRTKLLIVLAALFILTACSSASKKVVEEDAAAAKDRQGGSLTVPLTNFDTLNPLLTQNRSYYQLTNLLYDRLFVYEGSGRLVPSLVEHVEFSNDRKRVSLTIKDKIYWQDGTPLTTEDIAETFQAVKEAPGESVYKRTLERVMGPGFEGRVRAVVFDRRNIDFEFDRAYSNYMELLNFPILPAHVYSKEGMLEKDHFKVVASGPFTLKRWERNKRLFLEKNQNYHGSLPYVDEIVGLIFSDDEATRQAYEAGQIDMMVVEDYTWDRYRSDEASTVESFETQNVETLALNTRDSQLADVNLRRAIDLSVNKERIIDSLYLSQGTIANFFINPKLSGGLFTREESYLSVDAAMALLEKAGYRDRNNDGFREGKGGEALTLTLSVPARNHRMRTEGEMIADDLKKVGLRVQVTSPEGASETGEADPTDLYVTALRSGAFQMALVGMDFSAVPDLEAVLTAKGIGGMNVSGYSNPKMDAILQSLDDGEEESGRAGIEKAYTQFRKDVPYVPIVFKQKVLVTGARVEGKMRPNALNIYNGINDVYIQDETENKKKEK